MEDIMVTDGIDWRVRMLRQAGMTRPVARGVGADLRYDVLELVRLLELGCPEQLALRIAAPDDAVLPMGPRRVGGSA
jgi:hypothetical protein